MKEFFKSPKKTAILGLVGGIGMILYFISIVTSLWDIINNLYIFGFIIYFIIILMRLFFQKGSVKVANYILIISYILSIVALLVMIIPSIQEIFNIVGITYILMNVIIILYFCNIFFKKAKIINNKVFGISLILYVIFNLVRVIKGIDGFMFYRYSAEFEITAWAMLYIGYLLTIPYFYNYYELVKGEK